jgi:hypothetical protein
MMRNRGTINADECDAFSRKARRLLHWRRGELRVIKRGFSKRVRFQGRQNARAEVAKTDA